MKIIDQRDVQRYGGLCVDFPVSCVIRDLLREAGILKPFRPLKVLDLTFGEGRFWGAIPQAKVWGFDIVNLKWYRRPYVFFLESCENWRKRVGHLRFDLVVVDPPFMAYRRGQERRRHYVDRGMLPLILNEGRKAAEYFKCPLLVHFMWKVVPFGFDVIAEVWFKPVTRFLNVSNPTWFGVLRKVY